MSDSGLSHRLRQRSRRAGLMIGLSMVLTIAVCAMGFTVIYSALDGITSDFISQSEDTPTPAAEVAESDTGGDESVVVAAEQNSENGNAEESDTGESNSASNPEPTPAPEQDAGDDDDAEDTDQGNGFDPDYQLGGVTVNLRSGPSTSDSIVTALPPSTPLEYLDEEAPTTSPEDGDRWMRFTTEDGREGWIREIDVDAYEP